MAGTAPAAVRTCPAPYQYAGVVAPAPASGVSARIAPLAAPLVRWGHVAAWVGVGGPGRGPGGSDEWIQAGLSGFEQGQSSIYYEVARPGATPQYTEVAPEAGLGQAHTLAVLEVAGRPDWWRVWVDGAPAGAAVRLPGSHGRWEPMAMAESWNGGHGACNDFRYAFRSLRVAAAPGGSWRVLRGSVIERGDRVLAVAHAAFTAAAP